MFRQLKPGTRVRDMYQHSETHTVVKLRKHEWLGNVRYFGSEDKGELYI